MSLTPGARLGPYEITRVDPVSGARRPGPLAAPAGSGERGAVDVRAFHAGRPLVRGQLQPHYDAAVSG